MTATTLTVPAAARAVEPVAGIPAGRLVSVELQKMFDTRAGFWLLASIGITSVLATAGVILWAPDEALTYDTFGAAIGFPMAVILPMIAILSVTSEWSQRSGLSTFTLVPHRGRVVGAKAVAAVLVGVVSMLVALAVGALGNLVGTAITGTDRVWDTDLAQMGSIILANVLGLLLGFGFGLLLRSSAAAIVAYFVYTLLVPTIFELLAATQDWFADLQPWIDFQFAQGALFDQVMTGERWAQLATAGAIWLLVPLVLGVLLLRRSEVK